VLKWFFMFSLQVAMGIPTFSSPGRRGLVVHLSNPRYEVDIRLLVK